MRGIRSLAAIALLAGAMDVGGGASAPAKAQTLGTCRVADPSGTPLNVRLGPQGRIVGTVRNGTVVRIASTARDHKQQSWVQVVEGQSRRTIGWVLRDMLNCY